VTASLAVGHAPDGSVLRDLGEHRLRDLSEPERVFQLVHPDLHDTFPPLRSLNSYPGNLPIQPTAFVGRDAELTEMTKALEDSRVVTLCGVGGVGKTRLALQVAAEVVPRFRDGAWLVELGGVGSADTFDEAVGSALGVQQRPGTTLADSILDYLRAKTLLLVLDNCEHLLNAAARFVDTAVKAAPALRVLATSREGLAVAGERVATVPSLELPEPGMTAEALRSTEAVQLFVERARESNSEFAWSTDDAPAVAELCRRLDGIPLAIELAAARVRAMTPTEITAHLDRRFKLLTRGRRTAVTRHQTLRNTLDWSYDLLDDQERLVLRRLAVFAGGFDLDAAEAVVAGEDLDTFEVLDLLVRLVEKSLVVAERRSGVTRYRLLETIRDYAWDRLEESSEVDNVAGRHAAHFVAFAVQSGVGLPGRDEMLWRDRVEQDLDNLRAAVAWTIATDNVDMALTAVNALTNFGSLRTPPFGMLAEEVTHMPGATEHPLVAVALASVCMTLTQHGDLERAWVFADAAKEAADSLPESPQRAKIRCTIRSGVSTAIAYQGDVARLIAIAREAVADGRAIGDQFEIAQALVLLSSVLGADETDEAIRAGEEALTLARANGAPSYIAFASMMLATRLASIDPIRAQSLSTEAVEIAELADNEWAATMARQMLANVQAEQGDHLAAARTLLGVAERAHGMGDRGATQSVIGLLACELVVIGDDQGALLLGAWADEHGYLARDAFSDHPGSAAFAVGPYVALRDRQEPSARSRITREAGALDNAEIVALARLHVSRLLDVP
jgi:predicted ATPase